MTVAGVGGVAVPVRSEAAHARRKQQRSSQRKKQGFNPEKFLSDLPEEVDIRYRTSFVVVGCEAKALASRTCKSSVEGLPTTPAEEAPTELQLDQSDLASAVEHFLRVPGMSKVSVLKALACGEAGQDLPRPSAGPPRQEVDACFCQARRFGRGRSQLSLGSQGSISRQDPFGHEDSLRRQESCGSSPSKGRAERGMDLIKMTFRSVTSFLQELPRCSTRKEALSTCMVFVLVVDECAEAAGEDGLAEQLQNVARWSQEMSLRTQDMPETRPWRAALLVRAGHDAGSQLPVSGGGSEPSATEEWRRTLDDWEARHGELWKFGPIPLEDGSALHATFAQMAGHMLGKSLGRRASTDVMLGSLGAPVVAWEPSHKPPDRPGEERSATMPVISAAASLGATVAWAKKLFGLAGGTLSGGASPQRARAK